METVRANVLVGGRVQGVFFRYSAANEARARELAGWVRNRPDGRVEAEFQGSKGSVEALIAWCRQGPPGARVEAVEVAWLEPEPSATDFRVTA